jgi:2-phosphosulfolactate phosphatase
MALARGANEIVTGSFLNLSAINEHLLKMNRNVILACAGWKDKVNLEDTLFAGAVINEVKKSFNINCDASQIAQTIYSVAKEDLYGYMKDHDASHYHRLINFGLEKDIRHCLTPDLANVLPEYISVKLVSVKDQTTNKKSTQK